MSPEPIDFDAVVGKISSNVRGIFNPCVVVPGRVVAGLKRQSGKGRGPLPVRTTLRGKRFRATVVRYAGRWRLYLNQEMRDATGLAVGDGVRVRLEIDRSRRTVSMPGALRKALSKNRRAGEIFHSLAASRRNEILRYLGSLKTAGALERNIRKLIGRWLDR